MDFVVGKKIVLIGGKNDKTTQILFVRDEIHKRFILFIRFDSFLSWCYDEHQ